MAIEVYNSYPLKRPFIKSKGFCPNPIAKHGIPYYADSAANPKVIGTPAWTEFWEEQFHYILNGYITAGVYIPPRYYHFLNFCKLSSVDAGEPHYPDYVDTQYELALLVEEAKRIKWNIITPKGGRKGLSETASSIIDYGYRFTKGYHAGIAAGAKEYSDDFLAKWKSMDSLMVNEFKVRKLSKGWDDIIAGWEEKQDVGGYADFGTKNTISNRTAGANPNVFEGKYVNEVVFEEAGLFDNLLETFDSVLECMKRGNIQYGTFYVYGRGGNIKSGSKGFQYMYYHAEDYKCLRHAVLGKQYYIPCVAGTKDPEGKLIEDIPNLLIYTPEERIGMEDTVRAEELIQVTNEQLKKSGNIKKWVKHSKDNPLSIQEIFRRASSNNFDNTILNKKMTEILEEKKYSKYIFELEKKDNGSYVIPYKVNITPAKDTDDENDCIMVLDGGMPMPGYRNLDVAGIDSYDQDQSLTSKSLGAMVVYRRKHRISNMLGELPVCLIRNRPEYKEKFYHQCLCVSIAYNLIGNVLGDVSKTLICNYFEQMGCYHYLADRPKKFESENSEQHHDKWVSLNVYSKPLMVALMQTDIRLNGHKNEFPQLVEELQNYDEMEKGSDNDSADAYGIALMQAVSIEFEVTNDNDAERNKQFEYPSYYEDQQGNIRMSDSAPLNLGLTNPNIKLSDEQKYELMVERQVLYENLRSEMEDNDS